MTFQTILLVFLGLLVNSCSDAQNQINILKESQVELGDEYSDEEGKALDALDKIQISGNQLYSTFPGSYHDCSGKNSSYTITQNELNEALKYLLNQYYLDISEKERIKLASVASKAQKEYLVISCSGNSGNVIFKDAKHPPKIGTWIFKSILDQRDLIIKWDKK
jgi:hypothetical protein